MISLKIYRSKCVRLFL